MTVQDCYTYLRADFDDTLRRFGNEERVRKFLKKFPVDGSFSLLSRSLQSNDLQEAFRAAHTLKGISANLGLTVFNGLIDQLTECLRPQTPNEKTTPLYEECRLEYDRTVRAIDSIEVPD